MLSAVVSQSTGMSVSLSFTIANNLCSLALENKLSQPKSMPQANGSAHPNPRQNCRLNFFLFFFFFLILIFVPQPGIGPTLAALEAQSLNHWTAREVPKLLSRNWQWLARVVRKGKIHVCGYHWICRQAMECKYLVTENWLPGADGVSVWLSWGPFCTSHVYMGPLFPSKQRVRGLAPLLLTELLERNVSF